MNKKKILFIILIIIVQFFFISLAFAKEKDKKEEPPSASVKIDESITQEYNVINGIIVKDKKDKEGSLSKGKVKITGKKVCEEKTQINDSGELSSQKKIDKTINFTNRVTSRTILKAIYSETTINDITSNNSFVMETEHKLLKNGPVLTMTGSFGEADHIKRNKYGAQIKQKIGKSTNLKIFSEEEIFQDVNIKKVGIQLEQKITPTMNIGLSQDKEITKEAPPKDKTSLIMEKRIKGMGIVGARYQLLKVDGENKEDRLGFSYRRSINSKQLKFFADYEYGKGDFLFQKTSLGISRKTSFGSLNLKYLQEIKNDTQERIVNKGFFMGLTKKF